MYERANPASADQHHSEALNALRQQGLDRRPWIVALGDGEENMDVLVGNIVNFGALMGVIGRMTAQLIVAEIEQQQTEAEAV